MGEEKRLLKVDEKIKSFKLELRDLMTKYNFGKHESDNYDGMDEYCGTDIYFTVDEDVYYAQTVSEIIDECV